MKRIALWSILAGCLIAGSAIALAQAKQLQKLFNRESTAETPVATPVATQVGALGRIEPSSEILDIDAPLGDRVSRLLVKEGDKVEKGKDLAELESHDVTLAEKQEIEAQLQEARLRASTTKKHSEAMIRTAEAHLQTVLKLEPLRINSQEARLRAVEAECKQAEAEFRRAERLLDNKTLAREDHDRREVEYQKQQELQISARLTLTEMKANFVLAKLTAEAELDASKAALDQAVADIPVRSLEKKLAFAEARLLRTTIRAPLAGQVLKIHTREGERIGNGPILQLGSTSEMHAVAEVYETDIPHVRVGQPATISCAALGKPIKGTVVQVGMMIYKNDVLNVDPAADADARVVEVRIRLDEPERVSALTNLQVDVLIDIAGEAK